jgi:PAS domain S-box-containing protein
MKEDLKPPILVLDDDRTQRETLCDIFTDHGYPVVAAGTGKAALEKAAQTEFGLALVDIKLGDMTGIEVLKRIKRVRPDPECIIITAHASQESAIEALNLGAYSYLEKPLNVEQLLITAERALEKHAAERELEELKSFHEGIVQNMAEGVAIVEEEGIISFLNPAACDILGHSREELLGKHWAVLVPSKKRSGVRETDTGHLAGAKARYEVRARRKDGSNMQLLVSRSPHPSNGKDAGSLVVFTDITQRKQVEEALKDSEDRFKTLFENAPDAYYLHDLKGKFIDGNRMAEEITGYKKEELIGKSFLKLNLLSTKDMMKASKILAKNALGQSADPDEFTLTRKDGGKVEVEICTKPVRIKGQPRVLGIARDISKRKRAEGALQRSEEKYKAVFDNTGTATVIIEEDTTISLTNKRFEELSGWSADEIEGKMSWTDFVVEEDLERMMKYHYSRREKGQDVPTRYEFRFIDNKNQTHNIFLEVETIPGTEKSVASLLDITQRKKAEGEVNRRYKQLNALREVGLDLVSELDVDELLENIVARAVELVDGEGGCLYLMGSERDALEMSVRMRYESFPEDITIERGLGLAGQVWANKERLLVEDYAAWEGRTSLWVDHIGHRAMAGIPVIWRGEILGVLEIIGEPENPFSDEDTWVLELFANQAAAAMHNASLFEQAQQRLERLRSLQEIDRAVSGSLDLKTTLSVFVKCLIENLGVDAADFLLYQPTMQNLEFVTGSGFRNDTLNQVKLRIGEGHAGRAALEGEIVHIPDLNLETVRFERAKLCRREGFVAYFGVPLIAKGEIVGVLEVFHRSPLEPSSEWIGFLETLAGQAAIAIDRLQLFVDLERSNMELMRAYNEVIEGWARALELRDHGTEGHSRRVEELTLAIAKKMGVEGEELSNICQGALLHDIGKMGIPDAILQKPGPLNEDEWKIMKQHPTFAYEMLSPIDHLKPALDIPYCHHEKWDGNGYPQGLKGEEIPLSARIFAVVDVWDALRSDRPYRDAWSDEKALAYIKDQAGKHFDPRVVEVFLEIVQGE